MKATTESAISATIPMQLRCRRQLVKSSSDQGNSNASCSMATTSDMSRRIIHRTCTPKLLPSKDVTTASPLG